MKFIKHSVNSGIFDKKVYTFLLLNRNRGYSVWKVTCQAVGDRFHGAEVFLFARPSRLLAVPIYSSEKAWSWPPHNCRNYVLLYTFPLVFRLKFCIHILCLNMRIMPTYFTLPDLISLVIFGEGYKIRTSSYCNNHYPPLTNYLIVSNILLNILCSESVL